MSGEDWLYCDHSTPQKLAAFLSLCFFLYRHRQQPSETDICDAVRDLNIDDSRVSSKYSGPVISTKDFLDAITAVKPTALREIQIEVPKV